MVPPHTPAIIRNNRNSHAASRTLERTVSGQSDNKGRCAVAYPAPCRAWRPLAPLGTVGASEWRECDVMMWQRITRALRPLAPFPPDI